MKTAKCLFSYLFFLIVICFHSCKKNEGTSVDPPDITDTAQAVITAKGTPFGDIAKKDIGPGGGTIVSEDGGATLVIPPGALSANTAISIQAVTNTLPQALGEYGYQFLPENLRFLLPAKLTLKYDTAENQGVSSAGLVIANQEADGSWMHDAEVEADENNFTLTADMEHFSTWTIATAVTIEPKRSSLEPGGKRLFVLKAMEKYTPIRVPGRRREKAVIKTEIIFSWLKQKDQFFIQDWRLNYNNSPGLSKDGMLKPGKNLWFADYTAPSGLPPAQNPVLIQGVVGNKLNQPNLIANAIVFIRKNGFVKVTIGGETFNYTQNINEPSSNSFANASVIPYPEGYKIIVNAINTTTGNGTFMVWDGKKGTNIFSYKKDVEQIVVATGIGKSWKQEYYTRDNGNGTRRCDEFGPKYKQLTYTMNELPSGISDWFAGTITGTLYNDTDENRRACQNSDSKSVRVEFVLKAGN